MHKTILFAMLLCQSVLLSTAADVTGKNDGHTDVPGKSKTPASKPEPSQRTMFCVGNEARINRRGVDDYIFEIPSNKETLSNFKIRVFFTETAADDEFIYDHLQNVPGAEVPKKFGTASDFVDVSEHSDKGLSHYPTTPHLDKLYVVLTCDWTSPANTKRISSLPVAFQLFEKKTMKRIGINFKGIKSIDFETKKDLVSPFGTTFSLSQPTIYPNLDFVISSDDSLAF